MSAARRLYLATTNAGKLAEFRALLEPRGFAVLLHHAYVAPPEDAPDYATNAAAKAHALAGVLRAHGVRGLALGDDSGLEVDALGGRPGVRSARYGPPEATWAQRRALLIAELDACGDASRDARFVCALHVVDAEGRTYSANGVVAGAIVARERGAGGFSYDALFLDAELGRTYAEFTREEKNARSHRAAAVAVLLLLLDADGEPSAGVKPTRSYGLPG